MAAWHRAIGLCIALLASAAGAQDADLVIGYRPDVPPFSHVAVPAEGPRQTVDAPADVPGKVIAGYMINICTRVIAAMQERAPFSVAFQSIESANARFELLESGEIDVLCDPATINGARMALPSVMVSMPVYLSGVGLAENTGRHWSFHWPCIGAVVGIVAGTTAADAVTRIADSGGFGPTFSQFVSAHPYGLTPTLSAEEQHDLDACPAQAAADGIDAERLGPNAIAADPADAVIVRDYPDYAALARALCQGEILYSVGDLEIIATALESAIAAAQDGCPARINPRVFTEEHYGIFVHAGDLMGEPGALTRSDALAIAFLRQLSIEVHKGTQSVLVDSFVDNFDRTKISRSLDLFFWSVVSGG